MTKTHLHYPLLILLVTTLMSGCTSYRSKSGMEFDSADIFEEPRIPVGEVEQTPDQFSFVASIDAVVSRPTPFHKAATREQANIVLAEKAIALNADAVTYVEYEEKFGDIWATGQAIRFNRPEGQYTAPSPVVIEPVSRAPQPGQPSTSTPMALNTDPVARPATNNPAYNPAPAYAYKPGSIRQALAPVSQRETALMLASLKELLVHKPFLHSPLEIRIYTSQTVPGVCQQTLASCPDQRLFILVKPDSHDLPKLYELPAEKGWKLVNTSETPEMTVILQLQSQLPNNMNIRLANQGWKPRTYTVWLGLTPTFSVSE